MTIESVEDRDMEDIRHEERAQDVYGSTKGLERLGPEQKRSLSHVSRSQSGRPMNLLEEPVCQL